MCLKLGTTGAGRRSPTTPTSRAPGSRRASSTAPSHSTSSVSLGTTLNNLLQLQFSPPPRGTKVKKKMLKTGKNHFSTLLILYKKNYIFLRKRTRQDFHATTMWFNLVLWLYILSLRLDSSFQGERCFLEEENIPIM